MRTRFQAEAARRGLPQTRAVRPCPEERRARERWRAYLREFRRRVEAES